MRLEIPILRNRAAEQRATEQRRANTQSPHVSQRHCHARFSLIGSFRTRLPVAA